MTVDDIRDATTALLKAAKAARVRGDLSQAAYQSVVIDLCEQRKSADDSHLDEATIRLPDGRIVTMRQALAMLFPEVPA